MEILDVPVMMPDILGLPEYRVTEMYTEIDGTDVRMAFGTRRFGHIEWLYTVVVSPNKLIQICRHCEGVAIEAFNLAQLIEKRDRRH